MSAAERVPPGTVVRISEFAGTWTLSGGWLGEICYGSGVTRAIAVVLSTSVSSSFGTGSTIDADEWLSVFSRDVGFVRVLTCDVVRLQGHRGRRRCATSALER